MISYLFKNIWFKYPYIPKSNIAKIKFHPWKVLAFDGCSLLVKNLTTEKTENILITKFNKKFLSQPALSQLMHTKGYLYQKGEFHVQRESSTGCEEYSTGADTNV